MDLSAEPGRHTRSDELGLILRVAQMSQAIIILVKSSAAQETTDHTATLASRRQTQRDHMD
jgi:hypothetical protein